MKLSYRDKMLLLGVAALAIIALGIFLLIKPKIAEIKEDNKTLSDVKADWKEKDDKIQQIPGLQEDITNTYKESKKLSDYFQDLSAVETQYKLDEFMQPYLDECNIEVTSIDLGAPAVSEIGYYYFTPSVVTSSMFDAADVNGNYAAVVNAAKAESNALSERTKESVVRTQYGVAAKGEKEDIWAFMEKINNLDTTIIIDSVNISDYTFGEEARKEDPSVEETSEVTFVISIYSVFPMDEPVVE